MTGYAQWWEIVAILIGIGLLALEIFVIPGFGLAGLLGIALILGGLTLTFVAPEPGRSPLSLPRLPMTWNSLQQGLLVVVTGLFSSLLLSWWLSRYLPRLPYLNKLILTTTVGSESGMVGSLTNIDPNELAPAIGATGLAVTDLRPGGSAQFTDAAGGRHIVSVVCDCGYVTRGTLLIVREVAGNHIVVRPAEQSSANTQPS
jgi:membrane-bound serine protease (ClpP class)